MTTVTFIERNGTQKTVQAEEGMSLMVTAIDNDIEGIKAVCNGCCSCGTCHIELEPAYFDKASTKYTGEEQVLDNLRNRSDHSRLACQVIVNSNLDGITIQVK